ncbi:hypothetical protein GCM10023078_29710 [Gibbsiella greigii]
MHLSDKQRKTVAIEMATKIPIQMNFIELVFNIKYIKKEFNNSGAQP